MKKTIFLVILILSNLSFASKDRGGGDSNAVEFLMLADKFCEVLPSLNVEQPAGAQFFCKEKVNQLEQSLNNNDPKLIFTPNASEVADIKEAYFDTRTNSIKVYRPTWEAMNDTERFVLVSIEMSGLLKLEKRYGVGKEILRKEVYDLLLESGTTFFNVNIEHEEPIKLLCAIAVKSKPKNRRGLLSGLRYRGGLRHYYVDSKKDCFCIGQQIVEDYDLYEDREVTEIGLDIGKGYINRSGDTIYPNMGLSDYKPYQVKRVCDEI